MITLFVFVVIATLVLAVIRAEGMRPLGLALVGTISLVLGAGTTAIFTETSVAPFVNSMVFAQDVEATESPASSDEDASGKKDGAATTDKAEPAAQPQAAETSDPAPSAPQPSETSAEETAVVETESDTDVATAVETAAAESAPESDAIADDASPIVRETVTVEKITNLDYVDRGENVASWLESKPWTDDGVYFVPIESRVQILETDCVSALEEEIEEKTTAYINRFLRNKHASTLLSLRTALPNRHIAESFKERVVLTDGTVCYQTHALLSFDDNFREAVTAEWDEVRATSRLMQTGLGVGIVILLLSTMFSYFKLDTATRGYYTGRLQFAAAAAILTVIAASVLFANYVPWM